jgi:hypothetical protein
MCLTDSSVDTTYSEAYNFFYVFWNVHTQTHERPHMTLTVQPAEFSIFPGGNCECHDWFVRIISD